MHRYSLHSTQSTAIGRSRLMMQIATKTVLLCTIDCLDFQNFHLDCTRTWNILTKNRYNIMAEKLKFALVFQDDIIIFSYNAEQHILHVHAVVCLLPKRDVKLNYKKCTFFSEKSQYLVHVTRTDILDLADHTTNAFQDSQPFCIVKDLKLFLRIYSVYQRLVPNLSSNTCPAQRQTQKGPIIDTWHRYRRGAGHISNSTEQAGVNISIGHNLPQRTLDPCHGWLR